MDVIVLAICKLIFLPISTPWFPYRKEYAHFLSIIILSCFRQGKSAAHKNLEICLPHLNRQEREIIRKKMIHSFSSNIVGNFDGPRLTREEVLESFDTSGSQADVEKLLANDSGVGTLFLIPHYHNFELLSQYWCLFDKPFAILARGFGVKALDDWWNKRRSANGNIVFSRKGGFKEIVMHLSQGRDVAILFDQNVKRSHAIFVPFFGVLAATTKTIGLASLKTGCNIVFATMIPKTEDFKEEEFIVRHLTRPQDHEGSTQEKIYKTTLEANQELEKVIRKAPEHWLWIHRRFKTRPEGEPENFYD